nr:transposase [Thiocystis violacea]
MTRQLREHLKGAQPEPLLTGEVEADEVDVVASHTGQPDAVKAQGRSARRRRLKGARGRGTLAKEKPPILGLIQRGGELVIRMLENVQQVTIKPVIRTCVAEGTRFDTDEYDIDARLSAWGYDHQSVWSLLRSWLRPHRGLSQEHLPLYLSVFQFVHNARVRDKRLLGALLGALLAGPVWNP